jgi:hypothetical protein
MADAWEGASLEVRYVEPSLDLASLVACLSDAVPATPAPGVGAAHRDARERAQPLLAWQPATGVLAINTGGVLARLATSRGALGSSHGGFVRDAPVPRVNARAYLGGRIVEGTGGKLQQALDTLVDRIEAEIDAVVGAGLDPGRLVQRSEAALRAIGERVDLDVDDFLKLETCVRRTTLGPVAGTLREREAEIGRLMAAIEEVDGDRVDHFDRMAAAVRELLYQAGASEREIGTALEYHRDQAQRPGTQLSRFFDFLEDAALSRVRLEVTFLMMEAIAAAASARKARPDTSILVAYVRRATELFRALTAPDGEELLLNLSREFGAEADFALHDELITVGFAGCLPVWPEWVAQMFERQGQEPGVGGPATREVSYRFRVNGVTPDDGRPAFLSRLAGIRRTLLGTNGPTRRVRRRLAELVFLAAVIPAGAAADAQPPLAAAQEVARALEQGGAEAITRLLDDLESRQATVVKISRALTSILKTAGTAVTAGVAGRSWDFFVNVRRSLVDQQRIGFAVDTPLMAPAESPAKEMAAFFRQIRITAGRPSPGHLFSLRVRVRLAEGALRTSTSIARASIARELPEAWTQVVWRADVPLEATGDTSIPTIERAASRWLAAPRVEVIYQLRWLGLPKSPDEREQQVLATHRCGFSILAYTVLYCLLRRVRRASVEMEHPPGERAALAVSLFRLQRDGRGNGPFAGEQGLFAAAQAVELALSRDFDVRMQGLVLGDGMESAEKRRGLYGALFGGVPAVIERRGEVAPEGRIGLLVYGERPCNGHPEQRGQNESTLCTVRTYLARSVTTPHTGYRISCDASVCEVRDGRDEAELPVVVVEEIRRLYERESCRHVMVLSHRYGSRRIGGAAAARLRRPEFPRLLGEVATRFPGLCLYPLVRDTFPVTRLRERSTVEDAFEILRPDEHMEAYPAEARVLRHAYTPVYSLATLHVVGREMKPQSGFCTYFLLRDGGAGSIEAAEQIRANMLLPNSPVRVDLIAVLRGIHYLESERPVTAERTMQPVLDPYRWLQPTTIGQVGEVQVSASRRRAGTVVLSLPAVLERVSRVLHARRDSVR